MLKIFIFITHRCNFHSHFTVVRKILLKKDVEDLKGVELFIFFFSNIHI